MFSGNKIFLRINPYWSVPIIWMLKSKFNLYTDIYTCVYVRTEINAHETKVQILVFRNRPEDSFRSSQDINNINEKCNQRCLNNEHAINQPRRGNTDRDLYLSTSEREESLSSDLKGKIAVMLREGLKWSGLKGYECRQWTEERENKNSM